MANDLSYITKEMPRVVDDVFSQDSLTDALIGGGEIKLDFIDARTVKITKLASTGLQAYARGGHGNSNSKGAVASSHETFTLSQERFSAIPLDKLDALDDGETVFGKLASQFLKTKVVQEFDAYRFSKLASYTSVTLGNRAIVTEANLANKVIDEINKGLRWFADAKVPEGEIVIYVSPEVMYLIRSTTELYKRLSQSEYKGKVSFAIENYENKPIVQVPSDEFYTDITVSDGYYPSATSKKINFLMVWKGAPIIVKRLDWTKIYDSDQVNLGYVGYEFDNLFYHDLFVPDNKIMGVYCCVSSTDAKASANVLRVRAKAGASGKCVCDLAITQPAGILFDAIGLYTTDGTAPAIGSSFADKSVFENGAFKEFTPNASHNIIVATLGGKVVAVTSDFTSTLPVGA